MGIFAGKKAKTADLNKQAMAEELLNRGMDRDTIWKETGWFNDVSGLAMSQGGVKFKESTGYGDVDDSVTRIVRMTPDEYLKGAFEATDGSIGGDFASWMRSNKVSPEKLEKYAEDMKTGDRFPMVYIDYKKGSQDGRNRAVAASKAGAKDIPVAITDKPTAKQRISEIREELKTAKGYGKHRLEQELEGLALDLQSFAYSVNIATSR